MRGKLLFFSLFALFFLIGCTPKEEIIIPEVFYTVTFNVDGGSSIDEVVVESGKTITTPNAPTKDEFIFGGWFSDESLNTPFDFSKPITGNTTVHVKWNEEPISYLDLIKEDMALLEMPSNVGQATTIVLPKTGTKNNSMITWGISDTSIMNSHGIIFHPTKSEDDATITLIANFSLQGVSAKKEFQVTVPSIESLVIDEIIELPFTNMTSEYTVLDTTLNTFYAIDNAIPYVDISEFLAMIDGLIYFEELEFIEIENGLTINYSIEYEETDGLGNVISTETYTYQMTIDFELDTVTVDSLNFFDGYIQETETDYSAGLTYLDSYIEEGDEVTFYLSDYRFDLIKHEVEDQTYFLFPFHIANLLFTSGSYYNVYYNGDAYYGIYAFPDPDDEDGETEDGRAFLALIESSLNNTKIHPEVLVSTYDMLVFTLDYFYGLKDQRGITSYYDVLSSIRDSFMTGKTRDLTNGLFNIVNKTLDDLHSSYHFSGFYEPYSHRLSLTSISQVGENVRQWYDVLWSVQDVLEAAYPDSENNLPPDYRFIDNNKTAIIYLDGFETATVEDPDGPDSNRFMKEVMAAILNENPNVENIVIDLSYNTGGNLGALLRVLGFMTEEPIEMSYMNPLDNSHITYFVEVDTMANTDVNWFILTSKVTFSAANLMTSIAKDMGFATIIGTQTGGGASSITPIVLPDGTFIHMSSLNVLSYRTGNETDGYTYFSIEDGITPDYVLAVRDSQNNLKIAEVIEQALSN